MSIMIDLIGSAIIAGYVMIIGLTVNSNISATAVSSVTSVNVQESIMEATKQIESDFRKMGYRVADPTTVISIADSNRLKFQGDITRNGSVDIVEWYTGTAVTKANGLQVRNLYRKVNSGTATIVASNVLTFKLRYLDQDGLPTNLLTNIAMIETALELTSPYRVQDQIAPSANSQEYITTMWLYGRLSARNMNRHG
ncbi:MAG: hypothetical protein ABI623_05740 [bacterium]